jgi:hypothetical protein
MHVPSRRRTSDYIALRHERAHPIKAPRTAVSVYGNVVVPTGIADAGEHAVRRFLEFFAATIRNRNTREAFTGRRARSSPGSSGTISATRGHRADARLLIYRDTADNRVEADGQAASLGDPHAVDWLGRRPGARHQSGTFSARPKHVVRHRGTPVLTAEEAGQLLYSIDTMTLVGLRDRALIGVMTFAFARIGAVVAMRVEDYYPEGMRWWCACISPLLRRRRGCDGSS